jgi:hypothetical protein
MEEAAEDAAVVVSGRALGEKSDKTLFVQFPRFLRDSHNAVAENMQWSQPLHQFLLTERNGDVVSNIDMNIR